MNKFDMKGIQPFFPAKKTEEKDVQVEIPEGMRYAHRVEKRKRLHMLHVANAAKHLQELPGIGESIHCVMKGNFHGWDLVPAVLRLAEPATIVRLDVATLGFNNTNVKELADLIDAGKIGTVLFICSCYFKDSSKAEFAYLVEQMKNRGGRVAAVRSHAKILLMEMSDGRHFVIESSANLRSCHNVEQFAFYQDKGLLEFHREWMELLIKGGK